MKNELLFWVYTSMGAAELRTQSGPNGSSHQISGSDRVNVEGCSLTSAPLIGFLL